RMTPTQQEMIQQQTRRDMVQATRSEQELQREEAQVFGKEDDIANPIMPGTEITDNPAGVMQDEDKPYSARQGGPMGYRDEDDEEAVKTLRNVVNGMVNKHFGNSANPAAIVGFQKEFDDLLAP